MNIEISKNTYDVIYNCYQEDKELTEKYHILAGKSCEELAKHNADDLLVYGGNFYTIKNDNEVIGFFGHTQVQFLEYLSIFFVKPNFRKKEYISQIWKLINDNFNNKPFITFTYKKNIPANHFFQKNCDYSENLKLNNLDINKFIFNLGAI